MLGKSAISLSSKAISNKLLNVFLLRLLPITIFVMPERMRVAAFKSDGSAWVWGDGFGTVPVREEKLYGAVTAINHGGLFVLKSDGTVWARTDSRQENQEALSGGNPLDTVVLSQVEGLTDVISIRPGNGWSVVALKKDGTIWKFKNEINREGWYIGPVEQFKDLSGVRSMYSAFYDGIGQVNAAVKNDGTVWTWEDINPEKYIPSKVTGLSDVISVCAGNAHFAALKKDGTVWTWGSNLEGQLSDDIYESNKPAMVKGLSDITAISAGEAHTLVLKKDGTVWAWGGNYYGQLGNGGHMSGSRTPVQVKV
jgi:alpha-tubulin suppressor-like RCC1 family protein